MAAHIPMRADSCWTTAHTYIYIYIFFVVAIKSATALLFIGIRAVSPEIAAAAARNKAPSDDSGGAHRPMFSNLNAIASYRWRCVCVFECHVHTVSPSQSMNQSAYIYIYRKRGRPTGVHPPRTFLLYAVNYWSGVACVRLAPRGVECQK